MIKKFEEFIEESYGNRSHSEIDNEQYCSSFNRLFM